MTVQFSASGADDLGRLARRLKAAGEKELRKELYAGLNRASKPLWQAAKDEAAATLPQAGGLAARVAGAALSARTRAGANPGVRIVAKAGKQQVDVAALDAGSVRHPTFGRTPFVTQPVRPGWFTRPMLAGRDQVRDELLDVIDQVARKLEGG